MVARNQITLSHYVKQALNKEQGRYWYEMVDPLVSDNSVA